MTGEVEPVGELVAEEEFPLEELRIVERRLRVARLSLNGITAEETARQLNLPRNIVWRDLKALKDAWRREAADGIGDQFARDLAVLAEMERNAALMYQRAANPPADASGARSEVDHENARGWYDERLKTLARRARMLGYDKTAPPPFLQQNLSVNLTVPEHLLELLKQDDAQLESERQRLLRQLPPAVDQPDPGGETRAGDGDERSFAHSVLPAQAGAETAGVP